VPLEQDDVGGQIVVVPAEGVGTQEPSWDAPPRPKSGVAEHLRRVVIDFFLVQGAD